MSKSSEYGGGGENIWEGGLVVRLVCGVWDVGEKLDTDLEGAQEIGI